MSSTSTRNRRKTRTAPAVTEAAPVAVVTEVKSCEVCHIPGDDKTLKNHGTETLPYYMCVETPGRECDKRAGIIRDEAIAEDEAQAEGAAEEPVAVSK